MKFDIVNNFFDHIYVLTLRRAIDRQVEFKNELEGLNYTIFYGKDKNDFNVEELKNQHIYDEVLAKKHERHSNILSPGMIGCAWSHKLIYEEIIRKNYKKVLILEDDIIINQNNLKLLPTILKDLPLNWELLYFGFSKNERSPPLGFIKKFFYHFLRSLNMIKFSHRTIQNLYPKKISENIFRAGYHDCTHAYGLSLSGAKKLLELQTPISYFPDNLLAFAATNEIVYAYIILPKIIDQQYQLGISSFSYLNH